MKRKQLRIVLVIMILFSLGTYFVLMSSWGPDSFFEDLLTHEKADTHTSAAIISEPNPTSTNTSLPGTIRSQSSATDTPNPHDEIDPPHPALVLNVGDEYLPQYDCNNLIHQSRIFISEYPYTEFVELTVGENISLFSVQWDPYRSYLAFMSRDFSNDVEVSQEKPSREVVFFHYQATDRIYIRNMLTGHVSLLNDLEYSHSEAEAADGWCMVTGGLGSNLIWSHTGSFIAFDTYYENPYAATLYVRHIVSGLTHQIEATSNFEGLSWASNSPRLAYEGDNREINVVLIEEDEITTQTYRFPPDWDPDSHIDKIFWSLDDSYLIISSRHYKNYKEDSSSIWHMNLSTNTWSEVFKFDERIVVETLVSRGNLLACKGHGEFLILDTKEEQLVREIFLSDYVGCGSVSTFFDSSNMQWAIFVGASRAPKVWMVNFDVPSIEPILLVDLAEVGFIDSYIISGP